LLTSPKIYCFMELDLEKHLAPYAAKSILSRREHPEPIDPNRPAFKVDCHRIRNCNTSLRLGGKTQVLPARTGDHYRTRASHTDSVVTAARDIAERLNLNPYLAEAISLAHDLGHTPFGHAGEEALDKCMARFGEKFEHNEQSVRAVTILEGGYPNFRGLNLTIEVLDGLKKHQTPWDHPSSTDKFTYPTLEAQVVNFADQIAYVYHDFVDAFRRSAIDIQDALQFRLFEQAASQAKKRYGDDISGDILVSRILSALHGITVADLVAQTNLNIDSAGIKTISDVYKHSSPLVSFSSDVARGVSELQKFLHDSFYKSDDVRTSNARGQKIIETLFDYYLEHYEEIPEKFRKIAGDVKHIAVKDFIAGMTDAYAEERSLIANAISLH